MMEGEGGLAKVTEDDGGGSESPEFYMTSFLNAPLY